MDDAEPRPGLGGQVLDARRREDESGGPRPGGHATYITVLSSCALNGPACLYECPARLGSSIFGRACRDARCTLDAVVGAHCVRSALRRSLCGLCVLGLVACGRLGFDAQSAQQPDARSAGIDGSVGEVRGPGTWTPTSASPLADRLWTKAIWTGSEYLVFGGALDSGYSPTNTGARYDPETQTWTEMSLTGAVGRRHTPLIVWSGREALIYAGGWGLGPLDEGGAYDPTTDSWRLMPTSGAPELRIYGTTVAMGAQMMVWGGWANQPGHYQSGYVYDPELDQWLAMAEQGAPTARSFATAVWTGAEVIVWGGCDGRMGACPNMFSDGAIYDPSQNQWRAMSSVGAPSPRYQHTAVWTGAEMIVFGGATQGSDAGRVNSGGIYDPVSDSWRTTTLSGAPSERCDHAAAWIGNRMAIWGGLGGVLRDGYLYDPITDTWTTITMDDAPAGRSRFAYANSEDSLFVWGGSLTDSTGGVWKPE